MSLLTFRDPRLSRWQSVVDEVLSRGSEGSTPGTRRPTLDHPDAAAAASACAHATTTAGAGAASAASDPGGPPVFSSSKPPRTRDECARLALRLATAKVERKPAEEIEALEEDLKFGVCDPVWAAVVAQYVAVVDVEKDAIPYRPSTGPGDPAPLVLPENATVAFLGDWGTGTPEAIALLEKVAAHRPDVLIHLGDVYYSGTERENDEYFLAPIDRIFGRGGDRPLPVFALPGNHDMYSGGAGYYRTLDRLNRPPFAPEGQLQTHSFFALRSSGWQILGVDTALHDEDLFDVATSMTYLEEPELAWMKDKIRGAAGRRTILLSHHQLFSAFVAIGPEENGDRTMNPRLRAQLDDVLGSIDLWLWGHEHNLAIFAPYAGLARGRCIGHGAIPVLASLDPYTPRAVGKIPLLPSPTDPAQPIRLGTTGEAYNHGYVIARLDDAAKTARVSYYQDAGDELMFEEVVGG